MRSCSRFIPTPPLTHYRITLYLQYRVLFKVRQYVVPKLGENTGPLLLNGDDHFKVLAEMSQRKDKSTPSVVFLGADFVRTWFSSK